MTARGSGRSRWKWPRTWMSAMRMQLVSQSSDVSDRSRSNAVVELGSGNDRKDRPRDIDRPLRWPGHRHRAHQDDAVTPTGL